MTGESGSAGLGRKHVSPGDLLFSPYLPAFLLLPFLILAFFARPSADDLFLHYLNLHFPLEEIISRFYLNYSSRYVSAPLLLILTRSGWLIDHYFWVPLIFLGGFLVSAYGWFQTVNRIFAQRKFRPGKVWAYSLYFLLLYLLIMPEPSSGFYWLSACVTHTLPAIVMLLGLSTLCQWLFVKRTVMRVLFTLLSVFIIFGTSELLSLAILYSLSVSCLLAWKEKKPFRNDLVILLLFSCGCAIFLFLVGGNTQRANLLAAGTTVPYAAGAAYLRFFLVLTQMLKVPFFYVFLVLNMIIMSGFDRSGIPAGRSRAWMIYFALLPVAIYFFAYLFNEAGVPPRASNPVSLLILCALLAWLATGSGILSLSRLPGWSGIFPIFFVIMLVSSPAYLRSLENLVSGFLYRSVCDERVTIIREAGKKGMHAVTLLPYRDAYLKKVSELVPAPLQRPVSKLVDPYPALIFFSDDLDNPYWGQSFAEYYGIDTIRVGDKTHIRFSLSMRGKDFMKTF